MPFTLIQCSLKRGRCFEAPHDPVWEATRQVPQLQPSWPAATVLPHCTLQFGPDLSLVLGKLLEQAPINDCGVRLGLTDHFDEAIKFTEDYH